MLHILNLIKEGEHQQLDFKFAITDMRKIAKTLVAFANTNGGRLLIGVKDNGKIKGCRPSEERHMLEFATDEYCFPKLDIKYQEWIINKKQVLEVIISEGSNKPYFAVNFNKKKTAYIRILDEVIPMHPVLYKSVKSKKIITEKIFEYTSIEKNILNFINNNNDTEFCEINAISKITKYKTEWILADFINFDLIRISLKNNKWIFNSTDKQI